MKDDLILLGIDADDATRRFNGKFELFVKSLKRFVNDITTNGITDINEAMAMETEEFRRYVHSLKGVTANLSMREAYLQLIEIEESAKSGNPDFAKYGQFYSMFREFAREVLDVIISAESPVFPAVGSASGNEAECREHLRTLYDCLLKGMARESEEITLKLRGKSWDFFETTLISSICDAVDNYDYAKAMEIIDGI